MRGIRKISVLMAAGILALGAALYAQSTGNRRPAPEFSLVDSYGKIRTLAEFRGQVLVLNFWATWCAPCRAEMPWFQKVWDQKREEGLAVVGIALDAQGWRAVTPFLAQHSIRYPILLADKRVRRNYADLEILPQTIFIDRQGRIVARHTGLVPAATLEEVVNTLLAEGKEKPLEP